MVRKEEKWHHSEHLPFWSSSALDAEHVAMWYRTSLDQWGSHQLCPLPLCCAPPAFLMACWGEALTLCKHCSAITRTALNYQHCFHHKHKAHLHTSYCEENQLYPSQQTPENSLHLQVVGLPCLDARWPPSYSSYSPCSGVGSLPHSAVLWGRGCSSMGPLQSHQSCQQICSNMDSSLQGTNFLDVQIFWSISRPNRFSVPFWKPYIKLQFCRWIMLQLSSAILACLTSSPQLGQISEQILSYCGNLVAVFDRVL